MLTRQQCLKWIEELRSGDRKQGRRALRVTLEGIDHWCCLGVLADQLVNEPDSDYEWSPPPPTQTHAGWDLHFQSVNDSPLFRAERTDFFYIPNEKILTRNQQQFLAEQNDGGLPFERIADHIEKFILPKLPED